MCSALPSAAATASPPLPADPAAADMRSRARWRSSVADPRIQPGNRQVHQNVKHHEYDGVQEHQVLHDKDIALADRGKHRIAEPRCPKGAFDGYRSGKDKPEEYARQGN